MEQARLRPSLHGPDDRGLAVAIRRHTVAAWEHHFRACLSATDGHGEAEVEAGFGFGDDALLRFAEFAGGEFRTASPPGTCRREEEPNTAVSQEPAMHAGALLRRSASLEEPEGHGVLFRHGGGRDGITGQLEAIVSAEHGDGLSVTGRYLGAPRRYGEAEGKAIGGEVLLIDPLPGAGHGEGGNDSEASTSGVEPDEEIPEPEGEWGAADMFLAQRRTGPAYFIDRFNLWLCVKLGIIEYGDEIPMEWSWLNIMGKTIYQSDPRSTFSQGRMGDGSCVICSVMMVVHAQHRLAFERRQGIGTFPYELCRGFGVLKLKISGMFSGVWSPITGSRPSKVLEMMMTCTIGLDLTDVPDRYLFVKNYHTFQRKDMKPGWAIALLRMCGPIIGCLHVGPDYFISNYDPDYVYRGITGGKPNHAVVCVAYDLVPPGELHIRVVDNHRRDGPLRWIPFEVFDEFTCVGVDPLTPEDLPTPSNSSMLQRIFSFFSK